METGRIIIDLDNKINNAKTNLSEIQGTSFETNYKDYIKELENLKSFLSTSAGAGREEQFFEVAQTYLNLLTLDEEVQKKMEGVLTSGTTQSITDLSALLTTQITNIQKITGSSAKQKQLIIAGTTLEIKDAQAQVSQKAFYDVNQNSPEINKNDVINQLDSFIKKLPKFKQGIDITANMKYHNEGVMADMLGTHLNGTADVDLDTLEIENINQIITDTLTKYANELKTFAADDTKLTFTPAQGDPISFISLAEKQEFLLETAELLNSLSEEPHKFLTALGKMYDGLTSVVGVVASLFYLGSYVSGVLIAAGVGHKVIKWKSYSNYEKTKGTQLSPSLSKLNMNPKQLFGILGALSNTVAVTNNTGNLSLYKEQIQNKMASLVSNYATNNPGVTPAQLRSSTTGLNHGVDPTLRIQLHTLEQALIRADQGYVLKNTLATDGVHLDEFFKKIDGLTPERLELGTRLRKIPIVSPDGFTGGNKTPLTNNPGAIQSTLTIDGANESVSSLEFNHYNQIINSYNELMERRTNYQALTNMQNQRNEISTISDFVNQINQINPLDNSQMFDDFLRRRGGALLQYYTSEGLAARFAPGVTNNIDIRDRIIRGLEERYNILRTEINAHLLPGNKINQPIGQLDRAAMNTFIQDGQIGLENDFTRIAQELDATHTRLNGGLGNTMNFAGLNITDSKAVLHNHILDAAQTSHLTKLKGILQKLTK